MRDVEYAGFAAVDAGDAKLRGGAEAVPAGQRGVNKAQGPAQSGAEVAPLEVPLPPGKAAGLRQPGGEGVFAGDAAARGVAVLEPHRLQGESFQRVTDPVGEGDLVAAAGDRAFGEGNGLAVQEQPQRRQVHLRGLFGQFQLDPRGGRDVPIARRRPRPAQVRRQVHAGAELTVHLEVAGGVAVVEQHAAPGSVLGPQLDMRAPAALGPDQAEGIQSRLGDHHGAAHRADGRVRHDQAGHVPRVRADGQPGVVVRDDAKGVHAGGQIEVAGHLHGDVVSGAGGARNAGELLVQEAGAPTEKPGLVAVLLEVDQVAVEGAVRVGEAQVGHVRPQLTGQLADRALVAVAPGRGGFELVDAHLEPAPRGVHRRGVQREGGGHAGNVHHREAPLQRAGPVGEPHLMRRAGRQQPRRVVADGGDAPAGAHRGGHGGAVELQLDRRAAQVLDAGLHRGIGPDLGAQRQGGKQHRSGGDRRGGDGHVVEPVVGTDGGGQFRRAGADAERAGDGGVGDRGVLDHLHPVVGHVEGAVRVQADFHRHEVGRLVVGRAGAQAGKALRQDPLPGQFDDDAGRVAGFVPLGLEAGQVVHGVERNHQPGGVPAALAEGRRAIRQVLRQHETEPLRGNLRAAVDADAEAGGEGRHFLTRVNLREHIRAVHGQGRGAVNQFLQVLQFEEAILDLGLAEEQAAGVGVEVRGQRAGQERPGRRRSQNQTPRQVARLFGEVWRVLHGSFWFSPGAFSTGCAPAIPTYGRVRPQGPRLGERRIPCTPRDSWQVIFPNSLTLILGRGSLPGPYRAPGIPRRAETPMMQERPWAVSRHGQAVGRVGSPSTKGAARTGDPGLLRRHLEFAQVLAGGSGVNREARGQGVQPEEVALGLLGLARALEAQGVGARGQGVKAQFVGGG